MCPRIARPKSIPWWRCGTSEEHDDSIVTRRALRTTAVEEESGVCRSSDVGAGARSVCQRCDFRIC